MDSKEENIRKMLQESGLEKPTGSLSNDIMSGIYAFEKQKEESTYSLLQKASDSAPEGFTAKVMSEIPDPAVFEHKPIIGKFGWLGIGVSFAAMVIYIVIASDGEMSAERLDGVSAYLLFYVLRSPAQQQVLSAL